MESADHGHSYSTPAPFSDALRVLRRWLSVAGMSVVGELDLSREFRGQIRGGAHCAVLLVDCPLLFFEALALDRRAAAYIPAHVVISATEDNTQIHWAPAPTACVRVPVSAKSSIDVLYARLDALFRPSRREVMDAGMQQD